MCKGTDTGKSMNRLEPRKKESVAGRMEGDESGEVDRGQILQRIWVFIPIIKKNNDNEIIANI